MTIITLFLKIAFAEGTDLFLASEFSAFIIDLHPVIMIRLFRSIRVSPENCYVEGVVFRKICGFTYILK